MSDSRPPEVGEKREPEEWLAEARSIVRRVVEDWPYQPPEVIGPERAAFREWLDDCPSTVSLLLRERSS